jgi:hypothetical protein
MPELKDLLTMPELNECFLFHGTSVEKKDALINQGIDPRLGSHEALFGQGCYFAESSTKADQYAGSYVTSLIGGMFRLIFFYKYYRVYDDQWQQ